MRSIPAFSLRSQAYANRSPRSSGAEWNGEFGTEAGRRKPAYLRLWRSRFRSLRFLCLRIFFRRHLTTLPTGYSQSRRAAWVPVRRSEVNARALCC